MLSWIILGVMVLVVAVIWISNQVNQANQRDRDAKATQTIAAVTQKDLEEMNHALGSRIPEWKMVTDQAVHRVSGSDAGFAADSNTKEVDYGYCKTGTFYVYILEETRPGGGFADTEGYAYVQGDDPRSCHPVDWYVVKQDYAASNWYFVTLMTYSATSAAQRTLTPHPTETPITPTPTLSPQ